MFQIRSMFNNQPFLFFRRFVSSLQITADFFRCECLIKKLLTVHVVTPIGSKLSKYYSRPAGLPFGTFNQDAGIPEHPICPDLDDGVYKYPTKLTSSSGRSASKNDCKFNRWRMWMMS